jgi:hypothetical protein
MDRAGGYLPEEAVRSQPRAEFALFSRDGVRAISWVRPRWHLAIPHEFFSSSPPEKGTVEDDRTSDRCPDLQ